MGHLQISMMRRIVPSTKRHKIQVANLLKCKKPFEYCTLKFLLADLTNGNCHMNFQLCSKGFEGYRWSVRPTTQTVQIFFALIDAFTK